MQPNFTLIWCLLKDRACFCYLFFDKMFYGKQLDMKERQLGTKKLVRLSWHLTGKGEIPCQISEGFFSSERILTFN